MLQQNPLVDPISLLVTEAEQLLRHQAVREALKVLLKAGHGFIPGPRAQQLVFQGTTDSACMLMRALIGAGEPGSAAARAIYTHLRHLPEFRQALCMTLAQELQRMVHAEAQLPDSFDWAWNVCAAEALARDDHPAVVRFAHACSSGALLPILQLAGRIDPAQRSALMRAGFPLDRCITAWIARCEQLRTTTNQTNQDEKDRRLAFLAAQLGILTECCGLAGRSDEFREQLIDLAQRLMDECVKQSSVQARSSLADVARVLTYLGVAGDEVEAPDLEGLEKEFLEQLDNKAFSEASKTLRAIRATKQCPAESLQLMFFSLWSAMAEDAGPLNRIGWKQVDAAQEINVAKHVQLAEVLLEFGGATDLEYAVTQLVELLRECMAYGSLNAPQAQTVQVLLARSIKQMFHSGAFPAAMPRWRQFLALRHLDWAIDLYKSILRLRGCTSNIAGELLYDLQKAFVGELAKCEQRDEGYIAKELQLARLLCEFGGSRQLQMVRGRLESLLLVCASDESRFASAEKSVRKQLLSVALSMLELGDIGTGLELWTKHEGGPLDLALPKQPERLVTFVRTLNALANFPGSNKQELKAKLDSAWDSLLDADEPWSFYQCDFIVRNLLETLTSLVERGPDSSRSLLNFGNWSGDEFHIERDLVALVQWFGPLADSEPPGLTTIVFDDAEETKRFQAFAQAAWLIARIRANLDHGVIDATTFQSELAGLDRELLFVLAINSGLLKQTLGEWLGRCIKAARGLNAGNILAPLAAMFFGDNGGLARTAKIDLVEIAAQHMDSEEERYLFLRELIFVPTELRNSLADRFADWFTPAVLSSLEVAAMEGDAEAKRHLVRLLWTSLSPPPAIYGHPDRMRIAEAAIRLLHAVPLDERKPGDLEGLLIIKTHTLSGIAWLANINDDAAFDRGMPYRISRALVEWLGIAVIFLGWREAFGWGHPQVAEPIAAKLAEIISASRSAAGLDAPSTVVGYAVLSETEKLLQPSISSNLGRPWDTILYALNHYPDLLSGIPSAVWAGTDAVRKETNVQPDITGSLGELIAERILEMATFEPGMIPEQTLKAEVAKQFILAAFLVILLKALYERLFWR
ncbi:hypothetical protein C7T35_04265 [Variovorax sp. WS11]|nr:hypothetical protein C7T35_04265 [Variovorax sp. WS11]